MAGKYLKKNKQVITFNTLTALAMLAETGAKSIENATGKQICDILRDGPSEIQVIIEDDSALGMQHHPLGDRTSFKKVPTFPNNFLKA